jgi:sucrose phosphorylase
MARNRNVGGYEKSGNWLPSWKIEFVNQAICDHLSSLYGSETARGIAPRLQALVAEYASKIKSLRQTDAGLFVTERDALLITYADQLREPRVPPLRTLAEFAQKHLTDLVSGIHILPFYPQSSDDGFSVKDYFAVDPALGTWDDLKRLGQRFDLMFDGVFNHISARSEWFHRFLQDDSAYRDFFVTADGEASLSQVVRPRALPLLTEFQTVAGSKNVWTTFSADQVDLNFKNPGVLVEVLNALLFYVAHGAKFIRLDAIAYLWKEIGTRCIHLPQTHRVIQLMRTVLNDVAPHVLLVTETNVPHADNVSYFGDGTNEAQLVYNFALPPLVLHSIATGNAEKLTGWAQSLSLPSDQVAFFNFLASHDGIGLNPVRGILSSAEIDGLVERAQTRGGFVSYKDNPDGSKSPYELNVNYFDALSNPLADESIAIQIKRFILAHAIMLALAGVPGIYFHSLFGSRGDRAGAEASGMPRRINRQKLLRREVEEHLPDPNSLRARVFSAFKGPLEQRRTNRAFHPLGWQRVIDADDRIFALARVSPDGQKHALCLHNVTDETVRVALRLDEETKERLSQSCLAAIGDRTLQPYEAAWITADRT